MCRYWQVGRDKVILEENIYGTGKLDAVTINDYGRTLRDMLDKAEAAKALPAAPVGADAVAEKADAVEEPSSPGAPVDGSS